ncbi:nicotinate-nucleotide adenylyltransferase [Cohnella cholangitidis]|uniref:Probable nicotinate-nucleotide adenylyltransferase n=1 Tax=Cohnella cholangitidis TaxID=2598458 RepID=A0A7G5BU84_9BACL|nr:nicotinate-nucleotide adenylyltransferase [Cohnella cholangitidis]QMV40518.1 nicotinate-nucleotide adenylyltransferase [Cohnella cholangitidis]
MRKIGLLGGTFDPVHNGHLLAAQAALEAVGLDEVWFIPTLTPPHKPQPGADSESRRRMLDEAISDNPAFKVEDIELQREGTSYTIDTVTALKERHPNLTFYWIVGSDMVKDLPNWREIERLAESLTFIGLERPDQPSDDAALPIFIRRRLLRAIMPPMGISSSDIRRRLKEGRSIRYMLPEQVAEFIRRNGLYES